MEEIRNMQQKPPLPNTTKKADLGRRFIAAIIDGAIAALIGLIPIIGGFIGAAYLLLRDGFPYEIMDHRSVGKKLMRLRPITLDGRQTEIVDSVRRNWMFALGGVAEALLFIPILGWLFVPIVVIISLTLLVIEVIFVFTNEEGRRWGDRIANTKVIEVAE